MSKLRESNKKDMDLTLQKIDFWQDKMKMKVLEQFIPLRLKQEADLESLDKIQLLNKAKHKAMLLLREICEKQLNPSHPNIEDSEQRQSYMKLMISLGEMGVKLIDSCCRIQYCIMKMPTDKYRDVTQKMMAWNKFHTVN